MPTEELTINLASGTLALKIRGRMDAPPVLALHGWMDNAGSFDVLAPMLNDVRLIALDLPGHGRSSHRPPGAGYYIWSYLEDVLAVALALKLERFTLLGHSMGAAVACLLAALYPEKVQGLALLDSVGPLVTGAGDAPEQMRRALDKLMSRRKQARRYADYESAVAARIKGGMASQSAEILARRGLDRDGAGFYWNHDWRLRLPNLMSMTQEQLTGFLNRIETPSLLIAAESFWAERQDMLKQRVREFPDLEVVMLDGSHYQHLEQQAPAIADQLNGFFARTAGMDQGLLN